MRSAQQQLPGNGHKAMLRQQKSASKEQQSLEVFPHHTNSMWEVTGGLAAVAAEYTLIWGGGVGLVTNACGRNYLGGFGGMTPGKSSDLEHVQ